MYLLYQVDLGTSHFTGTRLRSCQNFLNLLVMVFLVLLDFRELLQEPLLDIEVARSFQMFGTLDFVLLVQGLLSHSSIISGLLK